MREEDLRLAARRAKASAVAAVAAAVVSWPLAGFTATADKGPVVRFVPCLWIAGIVLALGLLYTGWLLLWDALRGDPGAASRGSSPLAALGGPGARRGGVAALAVGLALLPLFATRSWTGLVLETMVYATIVVGLNISMGMAGLLVLGHAAFWAVGAYTFALTTIHLHWNFWLAFPAAGAAAAIAGLLLGLPALRLRGDYLAIVTLGFGEAVRWVLKNESSVTGGDAGIPGSEVRGTFREAYGWTWLWQPGVADPESCMRRCYWFSLALLAACVAVVALYKRSRFGRALLALREDETAARCMGIDTVRVKLLAFTASATWAGLAGVVHPIYRGQVTPDLFDFNASVLFVAMVVLGGLGSIPGAILGTAILWILPQVLRDQIPAIQDYRMLIFGAVLAAMMVVRPEGLAGKAGRGPAAPDGPAGGTAPGAGPPVPAGAAP